MSSHIVFIYLSNLEYYVSFTPLINNTKGPNLSGAEFNPDPGKRYSFDYIYPSTTEIDYYASKGFGIFRMPFDIARVYPIPYSPLNITEIIYMRLTVDHALSRGMRVILDPHNYGFIYDGQTQQKREIGLDAEGTKLFADFWGRMGTMFKNYPNVLFGLMNESNQQTAQQWYTGSVPAIKAIRDAGANQTILIPGSSWTGAHSWSSRGNAAAWTGFKDDSKDNFAFEMHQYLDSDSYIVGNITYVKVPYRTTRGWIETEWERIGNSLTLKVTVPHGSIAKVYVPGMNATTDYEILIDCRKADEKTVFKTTSGSYRFKSLIRRN